MLIPCRLDLAGVDAVVDGPRLRLWLGSLMPDAEPDLPPSQPVHDSHHREPAVNAPRTMPAMRDQSSILPSRGGKGGSSGGSASGRAKARRWNTPPVTI